MGHLAALQAAINAAAGGGVAPLPTNLVPDGEFDTPIGGAYWFEAAGGTEVIADGKLHINAVDGEGNMYLINLEAAPANMTITGEIKVNNLSGSEETLYVEVDTGVYLTFTCPAGESIVSSDSTATTGATGQVVIAGFVEAPTEAYIDYLRIWEV